MIADIVLPGATMMMIVIDGMTVMAIDMMMLVVQEAPAMRMIDVDEMMITGPYGRIVVMIGEDGTVAGQEAVAFVMMLQLLTDVLRPLQAQFHCQNVLGRLRAGTCMPQAMNNTPQYRRKLQVTVGAVVSDINILTIRIRFIQSPRGKQSSASSRLGAAAR